MSPKTHQLTFLVGEPRATSIFYVTSVLVIFAARYLPALRWTFKALYMVLGRKYWLHSFPCSLTFELLSFPRFQ